MLKRSMTSTEDKWRLYRALIHEQPLSQRQISDRIFRQSGFHVTEFEHLLHELEAEGLAKHKSFPDEWWRTHETVPDDYFEEDIWRIDEADDRDMRVWASYHFVGQVEVEIVPEEVGYDDLPEEARQIYDRAIAHHEGAGEKGE